MSRDDERQERVRAYNSGVLKGGLFVLAVLLVFIAVTQVAVWLGY